MDDSRRAWRIHSLIERDGSIEDVRRLIEESANRQTLFSPYIGLLDHAVNNNRADIVKLLIESGADVNQTNYGYTPLHRAAILGYLDIVKLLIIKRAEINPRHYYTNATPLDLALQQYNMSYNPDTRTPSIIVNLDTHEHRKTDFEQIIILLVKAGGVLSTPTEQKQETILRILRRLPREIGRLSLLRNIAMGAAPPRVGAGAGAAAPATGGAGGGGTGGAPAPRKQRGGTRRRRISRRR